MRVLVAGTITLTPGKRAEALAGAKPLIDEALAEPGCVAYDWTPDPYTDDVVHVFEEWESEQTLIDHLKAPSYTGMLAHLGGIGITDTQVQKYRVDLAEPVYDPEGVPRGDFFTA